jgi:uncharacterized protein (TIGR04255 family)
MTVALPRFARPPVVEVALSVMLQPITEFKAAHVGLLWSDLRKRYPKTSDQPPLESPIEQEAEPRRLMTPSLQFEPLTALRLRTWFLNEEETDLLQVQNNRIARNWRRASITAPYPSYPNIREPFEKDIKLIDAFLRNNELGQITPLQCEVAYVNHIVAGEGWQHHGDLNRVFVNWSPSAGGFLPAAEDAQFTSRYVIRDGKDFLGRLHVSMQSAYRPGESGTPDTAIFVLNLTARGKPMGSGIDGALKFLDLGHEWIVRGFAELTTPTMHGIWGREV